MEKYNKRNRLLQKNRAKKILYKFIMFGIKDVYSYRHEKLLNKGLIFAQRYIDINRKDTEIIQHVLKSLLFDEKDNITKKHSNLFDITMGAYDGAEVRKLVGTYMFSLISKNSKKRFRTLS